MASPLSNLCNRSTIAAQRTATKVTQISPKDLVGYIYDATTALVGVIQGIYARVCPGNMQKPEEIEDDWVAVQPNLKTKPPQKV